MLCHIGFYRGVVVVIRSSVGFRNDQLWVNGSALHFRICRRRIILLNWIGFRFVVFCLFVKWRFDCACSQIHFRRLERQDTNLWLIGASERAVCVCEQEWYCLSFPFWYVKYTSKCICPIWCNNGGLNRAKIVLTISIYTVAEWFQSHNLFQFRFYNWIFGQRAKWKCFRLGIVF